MLFSGADRVDLYYFGLGGTNGDAWIVIPALRTLIAGDAFAAKAITLIDKNNGGSATGYLDTLQKLAATVAGVDTIVTGHDGVLAWKDLLRSTRRIREGLLAIFSLCSTKPDSYR